MTDLLLNVWGRRQKGPRVRARSLWPCPLQAGAAGAEVLTRAGHLTLRCNTRLHGRQSHRKGSLAAGKLLTEMGGKATAPWPAGPALALE